MFARSLHLGRLVGISVRLDSSLLLFAVLIAWVFGANFLDRHGLPVASLMAVAATALFLASVLVHELAHGLEARYRAIRVHGVTLFFFGGMTEMQSGSRSPRDDFAVSAVGPYASLVCGALFGLAAWLAPALGDLVGPPVADVAGLLAWLNLVLAVFNLVPGAPLDGGRVLRAGLWWLLGDRYRAVRVSARTGQTLAALLVLAGLWLVVTGLDAGPGPDAGAWLALAESQVFGLVLILVGAFIFQAARTELAQGEVDHLLDHERVLALLGPPVPSVAVDRPLDLVDTGPGDRLLPVIDGDEVVGVLPSAQIRALHPADRSARTAGDLMGPVTGLARLPAGASLRELVDLLLGEATAVLIHDEGTPLAVLTEPEVARGLERLRRPGRGAARDTGPVTGASR